MTSEREPNKQLEEQVQAKPGLSLVQSVDSIIDGDGIGLNPLASTSSMLESAVELEVAMPESLLGVPAGSTEPAPVVRTWWGLKNPQRPM